MTPLDGSTRYLDAVFALLSSPKRQVVPWVEGPLPPGEALPVDQPVPWTTVTLVAAAVLLLYLAACVWWPFVSCRHGCERGRVRSPSGKAWRRCWWCKGRGSRVRWGRRLFDAVRGRGWRADV